MQELGQNSKPLSSEEASEDDDDEPIPSKKSKTSKTLTKMSLPHAQAEHDQSADSGSDMESGIDDDAESDYNDSNNDDCNEEHNSSAEDDFVSSDNNSKCSDESMSSDENDELVEDAGEKVQTNFENSVTSKQKRKVAPQVSSGSKLAVVRRLADLQKETDGNERYASNHSVFLIAPLYDRKNLSHTLHVSFPLGNLRVILMQKMMGCRKMSSVKLSQ